MTDEQIPEMPDILNEFFDSNNSEWHEDEDNVYHASWVWTCMRKRYYTSVLGLEQSGPMGLFAMGHAVEDVLFKALIKKYGYRFTRNSLPVLVERDGYTIKGETDPAIYDWNMVPKLLYEVKSSRAGKNTTTGEHHQHQASIYGVKLGFPEIRVVHPDRNDVLNIPKYDTRIDKMMMDALYDESMEWFDTYHGYVTKEQLPPAKPYMKFECKYCDFKDQCRSDGGWTETKMKNGKSRWSLDEKPVEATL